MKQFRIIGIFFAIVGIVFCVLGSIKYISELREDGERIYATGTIIKIEEYDTGDSERPTGYRTFVEFKINGEIIVSELNVTSSDYLIGEELEIYYFDNQPEMVYKKGNDTLLILFPVIGVIVVAMGVLLAFNKKIQAFLLKLPNIDIL